MWGVTRGPGLGPTLASKRPPEQGEAAAVLRGDRAHGRGKHQLRAAGTRPAEPSSAPRPAQPPLTGGSPTQPCPRRGGTLRPRHPPPLPSSLTAGRGDLPVPGGGGWGRRLQRGREGGGGRERRRRLRQCRSMSRARSSPGNGGAGAAAATARPLTRRRKWRERAPGAPGRNRCL